MRLICPNCDAHYEVDDSAIPAQGRDVQCSNCGHGWYQYPPGAEPRDEDAEWAEAEWDRDDLPPAPPPAAEGEPEPAPVRRALDESLLAVLREEAERESEARRAEAERAGARGLEIQPDLGLPPAAPPPRATIDDADIAVSAALDAAMAAGGGAVPAEDPAHPRPAAAVRSPARRDLLPDIEQINSTLRASSEPRPAGDGAAGAAMRLPETQAEARSGFRSGFLIVVLIAVLLAVLYVTAPRIAATVPAVARPLAAYVGAVDQGRAAVRRLVAPIEAPRAE
ncbi:zinc-ribbon domain-containing protein [Ruixingdingia sedimenti]|uniref:Zinc-ribbon domain-containing protein n=1 Tax=Ruixingdingia sedimenti TaxID=3073604 RepID=A0ABU1FAK3_9RHOB|nr:zinc-ribbon domain-containing protein [Xinfangfangia sp. LG-4]MDR5653447.1 zinc-ribbon domain-containing protein [Xinfangfangia sp. LG-4]